MSGPNTRVFLSCVTAEFEAPAAVFPGFRGRLRQFLAKAEFDPKIQEDLPLTDADTVLKMAGVVSSCGVVLHLVGAVPGTVAHPKAVAEFLAKVDGFLASHPELRAKLGDCLDLTYTQWEAYLALHYGVSLRVYATAAGRATQAAHLDQLKLARKYASDFTDEAHLLGQLLGDLKYTSPAPVPADRWFRTSRSPGNDGTGLSYLAVTESVVATTVFGVLVASTGWYFLLVTAVLMVPLALLRTDESDRSAEGYARRMLSRNWLVEESLVTPSRPRSTEPDRIDPMAIAWLYSVKVLVVVAVARLGALAVSLCRDFWGCIAAMPRNWSRICLAVDSADLWS